MTKISMVSKDINGAIALVKVVDGRMTEWFAVYTSGKVEDMTKPTGEFFPALHDAFVADMLADGWHEFTPADEELYDKVPWALEQHCSIDAIVTDEDKDADKPVTDDDLRAFLDSLLKNEDLDDNFPLGIFLFE